jgi:hypothetical protein
MRRSATVTVLVLAIIAAPGTVRAHWHAGCDAWEAGFAVGLLLPIVLTAAADCAVAPCESHRHYDVPPPVAPLPPPEPAPAPPPPAPAAPRHVAAGPAVGELQDRARSDPARDEAAALLGRGEVFKAVEAYRALAIQRPSDPEIALRFAEALASSGNYRYAELHLRRALRGGVAMDGARSPALARLAARRAAIEALCAGQTAGAGRLLAAYAALAAGDTRAADAHIAVILEARPGDAEALRLRERIARG